MITLVKKKPGEDPKVAKVSDTLETYQTLLGGHLELVAINSLQIYKLDLFCNEYWRDLGLLENLYTREVAFDGLIGGNIYIVSHDNFGNTVGLEQYQIDAAEKWLREHAIIYPDNFEK